MPLQRCVWFFQNNQIFWTSPSECTCAKLVNALSSASESPFHLKFHSSYYQWYQSTRTRQSPRFCSKIEEFCNEIGVYTDNMFPNNGHSAWNYTSKLHFTILQVNRQPKAFDYLKFWHNRIILVRSRAVCCVIKSIPMCNGGISKWMSWFCLLYTSPSPRDTR